MATEQEKIAAFLSLVGEDVGRKTLKQSEANQQTAEEVLMLAFKETDESLSFEDRLLDAAIAVKEQALELAATKARKAPVKVEEEDEEEEDDEEMDEDEMPLTFGRFKAMMGDMMTEMKSYVGSERKKEAARALVSDDTADALKEADEAHTKRLAKLENTVKELTGKLETATKELQELSGERPPVTVGGVRPTQQADNVVEKEAVLNGQVHPGSYPDFINWMSGGVEGGQ